MSDYLNKRLLILLITAVIPYLAVCDQTWGDNVRPAYLDIEEVESGTLRVVWKVPRNQKIPVRFEPSFPDSFKISSAKKRLITPDAMIDKWTMICGPGKLAGATIGIAGLEETTTDALVRIQLADGSLHRMVLRPTERSTTVPALEPAASRHNGTLQSLFRLAKYWPYVLLLVRHGF